MCKLKLVTRIINGVTTWYLLLYLFIFNPIPKEQWFRIEVPFHLLNQARYNQLINFTKILATTAVWNWSATLPRINWNAETGNIWTSKPKNRGGGKISDASLVIHRYLQVVQQCILALRFCKINAIWTWSNGTSRIL